ncbi:MAG: hypothetical protein WCR20_03075 [Verrucomicrobiota bacterium]
MVLEVKVLVKPVKVTVPALPGSAATVEPSCVSLPKTASALSHNLKLVQPVLDPLRVMVAAEKEPPDVLAVNEKRPNAWLVELAEHTGIKPLPSANVTLINGAPVVQVTPLSIVPVEVPPVLLSDNEAPLPVVIL